MSATTTIKDHRKAAVLMTTVGVDSAAKIVKHLPEDTVEALSYHVTQLGNVSPDASSEVLDELVTAVESGERPSFGGLDYATEVLERALDDDAAAAIVERMTHTEERRPFSFLRYAHPERIAAMLKGESAQTLALVLVSLPRGVAANVLCNLPEHEQAEVTLRVAGLGEIDPTIVNLIEANLKRALATSHEDDIPSSGGVACLAGIIRHTDVAAEQTVLDHFDRHEQELAAELRDLLLTFENIVELDDRSLQLVLREVDRGDLLVALRGTDDELRARIFANVSARGAAMLREDLQHQPQLFRRIVDEARARIVSKARELEDAGLLTLPRGDEEIVV